MDKSCKKIFALLNEVEDDYILNDFDDTDADSDLY